MRTWLLIAALVWALEACGVTSYVAGPLDHFKPHNTRHSEPEVQTEDDSAIYFPTDDDEHMRTHRSVSDSWNDRVVFSDLYPQTSLNDARLVRQDDPSARGPQNGWGNNAAAPPRGNQGFNSFPPFQPNRGGGNNRQWGNPGGTFNRPGDEDYEDEPFVFDRPPTTGNGGSRPQPGGGGGGRPQPGGGGGGRPQPGGGGGGRPQPGGGGGGRPQPGGGGGGRPQPGGGGGGRPQPGGGGGGRPQPGGGGGRPRPATQPPPTTRPTTAATTSQPRPGAPVTIPTPAPTRAGCNCPTTPEFNPVCGQDKVTYTNPGKLRCANFCGNTVQMLHFGSCVTTTTAPPAV